MPFKGTDKKAYAKASKGKTPAERKKIYYKEKNKNEGKQKSSWFDISGLSSSKDKPNTHVPNFTKTQRNLPNSTPRAVVHNRQPEYVKPTVTKPQSFKLTEQAKIPTIVAKPIVCENKAIVKKSKYVPRQLILDDLREYRSSKIISNISNGIAAFLMKTTSGRNMYNYDKNVFRSTVAFVTSEVINKALEKPLEIIANIKMFIKVGKAIYKVSAWFNEQTQVYEVKNESTKKVSSLSREYRKFISDNPKIKQVYKHPADVQNLLGKVVKVIVDRPIGSSHPKHSDIKYELNYGHLINKYANDGEEQDAYIIGVNEPISEFNGQVIAIIKRLNDIEDKLVVSATGDKYSSSEIQAAVDFQEKYFQTEILTK